MAGRGRSSGRASRRRRRRRYQRESSWLGNLQVGGDELTKRLLLIGDAGRGVDDAQAVFGDELVVLAEHLALEDPEALGGVRAPAHVESGLVELQLHATRQQAIERDVDRHAEVG